MGLGTCGAAAGMPDCSEVLPCHLEDLYRFPGKLDRLLGAAVEGAAGRWLPAAKEILEGLLSLRSPLCMAASLSPPMEGAGAMETLCCSRSGPPGVSPPTAPRRGDGKPMGLTCRQVR